MFDTSPILVISCEGTHRNKLADEVLKSGLRPVCCDTFAAARTLITREQFSAVVIEDLLRDEELRALITESSRKSNPVPVVIVSRSESWDSYLAALAAGAFDYLAYPPAVGELERALWSALSESKHFARMFRQSAA